MTIAHWKNNGKLLEVPTVKANIIEVGAATDDAHALNRITGDGRYQSLIPRTLALGTVNGNVAVNALSGQSQNATVDDTTEFSFTNLATAGAVLLTIDNTAEVTVEFANLDYTSGEPPADGIYSVAVISLAGELYATFGAAYEAEET